MKLSPEARQAIKTSIEQLRLLLVDDAMDTIREETRKHWVEDEKGEDEKITLSGDCYVEGKLSAGKIDGDAECPERLKKTFIQLTKAVIDDEAARQKTEKHPDEEVPEVEGYLPTYPIIRSATISNVGQSARLIQAANRHSFKRIYAEIDRLTEEVKALRSSNKKLKKRVSTLEKWEKIHR